jgi:hypothetical protein
MNKPLLKQLSIAIVGVPALLVKVAPIERLYIISVGRSQQLHRDSFKYEG